jgi:hypothetical protein
MILGERALDEIVERLAVEFSGLLPFTTLVGVLHQHVSGHPDDSAALVEAAARTKLYVQRQGD